MERTGTIMMTRVWANQRKARASTGSSRGEMTSREAPSRPHELHNKGTEAARSRELHTQGMDAYVERSGHALAPRASELTNHQSSDFVPAHDDVLLARVTTITQAHVMMTDELTRTSVHVVSNCGGEWDEQFVETRVLEQASAASQSIRLAVTGHVVHGLAFQLGTDVRGHNQDEANEEVNVIGLGQNAAHAPVVQLIAEPIARRRVHDATVGDGQESSEEYEDDRRRRRTERSHQRYAPYANEDERRRHYRVYVGNDGLGCAVDVVADPPLVVETRTMTRHTGRQSRFDYNP